MPWQVSNRAGRSGGQTEHFPAPSIVNPPKTLGSLKHPAAFCAPNKKGSPIGVDRQARLLIARRFHCCFSEVFAPRFVARIKKGRCPPSVDSFGHSRPGSQIPLPFSPSRGDTCHHRQQRQGETNEQRNNWRQHGGRRKPTRAKPSATARRAPRLRCQLEGDFNSSNCGRDCGTAPPRPDVWPGSHRGGPGPRWCGRL